MSYKCLFIRDFPSVTKAVDRFEGHQPIIPSMDMTHNDCEPIKWF